MPLDFSVENMHRNTQYIVEDTSGKRRKCFFDTRVMHQGAMFCVFTSRRNGEGNVVFCNSPVEIVSAIPVNAKSDKEK